VKDTETTRLESTDYASEQELENIVAANPYLLLADDEPELRLIAKRKISLPGSGVPDLIFLDETGRLTVVEVKLRRNVESRRIVVGQVFDYVSTLADLTIDDINERTRGGLEAALRDLDESDTGGVSYEQIRRGCLNFLRAGDVRVVVLMDDPSDELVRIMSFLNEHSDLDVRLISVQKHEQNGGQVFVPRLIVTAPEGKAIEKRPSGQMRPELAEAVAAFDQLQPNGLTTFSGSSATGWRQVRLPGWPKGLHYEFLDRKGVISTDFHAEYRKTGSFVGVLYELEPLVKQAFPALEVNIDPKWSNSRGRIAVIFPDTADAEEIARGMALLIKTTQPRLDQEIRARISTSS
jgi:hypothetical protein